jgi:membrane glycosyltransferase
MFLTGVMAYLSAPLWFAYLLSGTAYWLFADPGTDFADGAVPGMLGYLWLSTAVMLMLPRVLGVVTILMRGEQSQFGGTGKLCLSATVEAALSVLKAPIRMFAHTCFVLAALTGWRVEWQSPPREARALGYGEAASWFIGHTLLTLEWAFLTFLANPAAVGWLLPVFVPLVFAVPLTVASGNVRTGKKLREWHLLLTPEETAPPALLRATWAHARRYALRARRTHCENFPAALPADKLAGATA